MICSVAIRLHQLTRLPLKRLLLAMIRLVHRLLPTIQHQLATVGWMTCSAVAIPLQRLATSAMLGQR